MWYKPLIQYLAEGGRGLCEFLSLFFFFFFFFFVLVKFYWHHVRLFTEELSLHPRM